MLLVSEPLGLFFGGHLLPHIRLPFGFLFILIAGFRASQNWKYIWVSASFSLTVTCLRNRQNEFYDLIVTAPSQPFNVLSTLSDEEECWDRLRSFSEISKEWILTSMSHFCLRLTLISEKGSLQGT